MAMSFHTPCMTRPGQTSIARLELAVGVAAGLGLVVSLLLGIAGAAVGAGLAGLTAIASGLWGKLAERGQRLGPYAVFEVLGEGAMGVVFRARHRAQGRPVAVKVLPAVRSNPENEARFEQEARMTARLTHPNTVRVFDHGRAADGTLYYAMEHLEGATLADVVAQQGPMTAERAIHILDQIAAALGEAHDMGIIHRDIKPANIFLTDGDVVKVLDFGLVKQVGPVRAGDQTQPAITHDSIFAGTPLYMAPEAITTPDEVDGRTDLYALGAVGYFLVTGKDVFTGRSVPEVCGHHLHSVPVPPSARVRSPIPAGLEQLILRCLEKQPVRRPANTDELRSALRDCLDHRVALAA
jgi:serine/threonine protein kinase